MVFFVHEIKYHQKYSKYHQIKFKNSDETKGNNQDVQQHLPNRKGIGGDTYVIF